MKKQPEIDNILEIFRARESGSLAIDEQAVLKAYDKANADRSGIAIKVLTIIGGFLVTCAFLGFLFVADLYNSAFGMFLTGFIFVAGALIVKRVYDKLILDTFAVSFYICGCLLILLGAMESNMDATAVSLLFIIIALISMLFVQNYMISFAATCILHAGIIGLIQNFRQYSFLPLQLYSSLVILFFTFWLLEEPRVTAGNTRLSRLYNPVRLGSLFALLFAAINLSGIRWLLSTWIWYSGWISSIVVIACILLLIPKILKQLEQQQPVTVITVFVAAILALAPTIRAPSIAISLLIILLSFYVNYKTGIVAGILALIWFVSEFYYSLTYTLLSKSLMMMATGFFFLLLYFLTHKKLLSK